MTRWWGHFAAFIGTFVMLLLLYAFAARSHVMLDEGVGIAVLLGAVIYAFVRKNRQDEAAREAQGLRARLQRLEDLLEQPQRDGRP